MTTDAKQSEKKKKRGRYSSQFGIFRLRSLLADRVSGKMSSPLSMLKKTRRTPLQSPQNEPWDGQKVPFRRNLLKEFKAALTAADDDDGGEDECSVNPSLIHHSPAKDASTSKSKVKKGAPPSDFELMSAMMRRISLLESKVKTQAQEIEGKDKRISVLEGKLKLLEESESTYELSGRHDLESRCQMLQNQVSDMESFLNDYGLIWVGDGESSDPAESEQLDASVATGFHMNFDLVLQRIREMNILTGEGECFVQSTATGAHLAKKDPIQLSLYNNGIVMFDGPFRSYQEHSTQQCMQDLLDGYFPYELQDRFPDGAPFEVHDRRDEDFIWLPWNRFPGEGQVVHGEKDESSNAASSQSHGKSVDQFLNRLPKVVVKAGRVIDIRDSLREVLQGSSDARSSNSVIVINTPALQVMKERLQMSGPEQPSPPRDVITLKVKSEDGSHTYVLKMCFTETMGRLRQHLDTHRGGGLPGYDIISAYPHRCYDDDHQTLQSCGLTTNSTLLLRKRQQAHACQPSLQSSF